VPLTWNSQAALDRIRRSLKQSQLPNLEIPPIASTLDLFEEIFQRCVNYLQLLPNGGRGQLFPLQLQIQKILQCCKREFSSSRFKRSIGPIHLVVSVAAVPWHQIFEIIFHYQHLRLCNQELRVFFVAKEELYSSLKIQYPL
jgi:hypothetical protein